MQAAVAGGYDAFTTTLLYSRYQNHRLLVDKCAALADRYDMLFHYEDYRTGWQQGIDDSIRLGLYRQPYCGCIYSEQERYDRQLRRQRRKQSSRTAA